MSSNISFRLHLITFHAIWCRIAGEFFFLGWKMSFSTSYKKNSSLFVDRTSHPWSRQKKHVTSNSSLFDNAPWWGLPNESINLRTAHVLKRDQFRWLHILGCPVFTSKMCYIKFRVDPMCGARTMSKKAKFSWIRQEKEETTLRYPGSQS